MLHLSTTLYLHNNKHVHHADVIDQYLDKISSCTLSYQNLII